MGKHAFLVI